MKMNGKSKTPLLERINNALPIDTGKRWRGPADDPANDPDDIRYKKHKQEK